MNLHENTEFGRKVFFLNPSPFLKQNIIPVLFDREYEIYTIDSYKNAKNVLKKFPDSVCFICIDSDKNSPEDEHQLTADEWYNFIQSFEKDPILSTIFIGIISESASKTISDFFQLNTPIPAGFIKLPCEVPELTDIFTGILEINGAKGRRQFIRANCSHDPHIKVWLSSEQKMSVKNISFAGLACSGDMQISENIKPNTLLRDFILSIHENNYKCSGAVLMVAGKENNTELVIIFTKGSSLSFRSAIKDYIRKTMQASIDSIIDSNPIDTTDYSVEEAEPV